MWGYSAVRGNNNNNKGIDKMEVRMSSLSLSRKSHQTQKEKANSVRFIVLWEDANGVRKEPVLSMKPRNSDIN